MLYMKTQMMNENLMWCKVITVNFFTGLFSRKFKGNLRAQEIEFYCFFMHLQYDLFLTNVFNFHPAIGRHACSLLQMKV